jgi:ADP-ribose pyrophosphatase YjhB (NUDIX family)
VIRPRAICLFRRGDSILVSFGLDPGTGGQYARTLGGAIEFGERAEDALRREMREELGVEIRDPRLLGVLENIFEIEGRRHHEIIFVFDAALADPALYERTELPVNESACIAPARWMPIAAFGDDLPIYPRGVIALLRNTD